MGGRGVLPLSAVEPGNKVKVWSIEATGFLRERLLELGFIKGTEIEVLRRSPHKDPTAYRVRGATYALRASEARLILTDAGGS